MWRSILTILVGATLVASAVLVERSNQQSLDTEVRGIAMLRTRADSVRALYVSAPNATDSARFKKELDERIYGIGRREFHVPLKQETLRSWWTSRGVGTRLSAIGILIMLVGLFLARRSARAHRPD